MGFWEKTEERYNNELRGYVNQKSYYKYLNAGGKLFPAEVVQSYLQYLEWEWSKHVFDTYDKGFSPYGWVAHWLLEDFSTWLESDRIGKQHESHYY